MTVPADVWLSATLPIKLKSDKTVDSTSLAADVAALSVVMSGYKTGFATPNQSSSGASADTLPLSPTTLNTLIDTISKLDKLLKSSTGLVEVKTKPSSLTAVGSSGDYYVDLETSVTLPPAGPAVNFIYICLVSGNWIKLVVVP